MAQVIKISSFKSFTEIKNQETTMKLREENNAKREIGYSTSTRMHLFNTV